MERDWLTARGVAAHDAESRRRRDALLAAEATLRDQIEHVAALRRALPEGAPVPEDYAFDEVRTDDDAVRRVRLSGLFEDGQDTLLIIHAMWAPTSERPCPMCNLWADGYDAVAPHVADRASLALVVKQRPEPLRTWARGRSWTRIRLLSSGGSTFNRDYGAEAPDGSQRPGLSVFRRAGDGSLRHFYTTERGFEPGHHRAIDLYSPVFNLFDLLPEGRGGWMPAYAYPRA